MPRRLLVTLALAAALTACGGDDKLSPEDYRAEVRKLCTEAKRKTTEVQQPTRATREAIADYLTRLRDINAETIAGLEELEPPDELQDAHDRGLNARREGRARVDEIIEELEEGGDPTEVLIKARTDLQEATSAARKAGRDAGVSECGN